MANVSLFHYARAAGLRCLVLGARIESDLALLNRLPDTAVKEQVGASPWALLLYFMRLLSCVVGCCLLVQLLAAPVAGVNSQPQLERTRLATEVSDQVLRLLEQYDGKSLGNTI